MFLELIEKKETEARILVSLKNGKKYSGIILQPSNKISMKLKYSSKLHKGIINQQKKQEISASFKSFQRFLKDFQSLNLKFILFNHLDRNRNRNNQYRFPRDLIIQIFPHDSQFLQLDFNQNKSISSNINHQDNRLPLKKYLMPTNLAATTKLKVSQLYSQSFVRLIDRRNMFFIGHKTGIQLYDIGTDKIEEVKLDKSQYSGPFSCFTVSDELIFFCCGSKVMAMGSNLKILFELDTYLAVDKIDSVHVHGYRLFLISENMLNEFLIGGTQLTNKKSRITQSPAQKSQDIQEQVFDAKINHSLLITIMAEKPFLLLLKSNNQIQTFEKKQAEATFQTSSPPTFAYRYPQNEQNKVLVGTASGEILYLQVNKKSIKKLWSISEAKGKINTISELKNGFFVARDKSIEFWSKNKQLLKEQSVQEKTICSYYLHAQELLVYGTTNGNVIEMSNYEKYIKESKKFDQAKQRDEIIKEIELLKYKKSLLQQKLAAKEGAQQQKFVKTVTLKKINVKHAISIDYVKLCYSIEIQSQEKVCKIVCQGPITLFQEKENIYFEGQIQDNRNNVYVVRYENEKNIQLKVKYPQVFNELDKLTFLVYFSFEARVHTIQIDLKQLSLHQKVPVKSFNSKNPNLNKLEITGNFKFQMKMWMNMIFNEFSTEEIDQYETACYQSVITKNRILAKFKPGTCILLAESAIPLVIIKKKLLQKSRQKNLSLSFQTYSSPHSIKDFLTNIEPQMRLFIETKRKYDLLPGLLELKNQLSLQNNEELLKILDQRETITTQYKNNSRLQTEIKEKIMELYRSYKLLNNKNLVEFQEKSLNSAIQKWDTKSIISIITT